MTDDPTLDTPGDGPTGATPSRATTGLRAGVAAMLIGAVLVGVGVISTTSASDQPSCPDGSTAIARFDVVDGAYLASTGESPVTINDGTATGGTWTSSELVSAVVVKGGPGSSTTTVDTAQLAGIFDNSLLTPVDGVVPEILSVQFCGPESVPAVAASPQPYTVTLAARTCPAYTDIIANRNRNNIQESLEDLGPNTNYAPGEVVNPVQESAAPQDRCSPLTGWDFQWGTGITGKSPSTAELSTVTGENAIATTLASTPELDAAGNETGRTIEGAVTYTLTEDQVRLTTNGRLWIQGGTKALPLGDLSTSFGALRCATDNDNGDNVEYVRYPAEARHVFCFAYYVAEPPEPVSITVRKQLTEQAAGGTTFEFTGDTSFIPGGTFTLRPTQTGGSDEITFIRAADVAWTVGETVPEGWTLQSLECTPPESGRQVVIDGLDLHGEPGGGRRDRLHLHQRRCAAADHDHHHANRRPPPPSRRPPPPNRRPPRPNRRPPRPNRRPPRPNRRPPRPTTTTTGRPHLRVAPSTTADGPTTTDRPPRSVVRSSSAPRSPRTTPRPTAPASSPSPAGAPLRSWWPASCC